MNDQPFFEIKRRKRENQLKNKTLQLIAGEKPEAIKTTV